MSESNTPESTPQKIDSKKPKEQIPIKKIIQATVNDTIKATIVSLSNNTTILNKGIIGDLEKSIKRDQDLLKSILTNFKFWPWQYWIIIVASSISIILLIGLFTFIVNTKPSNLETFTASTTEALKGLDPIFGGISDVKNTNKKIEKSVETLTTNVTNYANATKQLIGKDATVQTDPNISTQLGALKTELSQLKGSIPADISSKLNELTISVKNMSSAPAAPATPATTVSKPTNIEFDAKKLKDALKTEFGTLTSNQSNLSTKIDAVSSSVSGSMAQMKADLDKINKIIGAQQEAKKEPKYQPVFLVVLSKGFKPQRDAIGSILQKLATPLPDNASKTPPTILVTADGNRQNVLSMAGYNQLTITTWLDNNDLREIKVPFDFLPTIINDKAGNSGQPKHVVILAGHNYQLDKTKDLSAWDKIEKITFVFVEPPFLSNLLWENFQKIQGLRRLKNLQTDVRIIKSMKDFDANFKLEVDEVDDITRVMKAALAD